jgi:NADH-quinone oxidoreductase subunit N
MAVVQGNVKRMLAFSSINHAGFILLGVEAASAEGTSAALFYLVAYTFMVAGSFTVVALVGRRGDGHHDISAYRGLSRSNPGLALAFTLFLLAQAGTPFTAGFMAKLGVIGAAADVGSWWLASIAMLSAVISAYLYLRIVGTMYFADGEPATPRLRVPAGAMVALIIAVTATLGLGIVPGPVTEMTRDATAQLVAAAP